MPPAAGLLAMQAACALRRCLPCICPAYDVCTSAQDFVAHPCFVQAVHHTTCTDDAMSLQDVAGYTALHYAASGGHMDTAQVLLLAGSAVGYVPCVGAGFKR